MESLASEAEDDDWSMTSAGSSPSGPAESVGTAKARGLVQNTGVLPPEAAITAGPALAATSAARPWPSASWRAK